MRCRILVYVLLLCFTFQQAMKPAVVAWWLWNRKQIALTECENRDKPEMNCCGKCVLTKKLRKTEENPAKSSGKEAGKKSLKEDYAVLPVKLPYPEYYYPLRVQKPFRVAAPALLAGTLSPPFHPPQV